MSNNPNSKVCKQKVNLYFDGTPCAEKFACTVLTGGKLGDNIKELPIRIHHNKWFTKSL